MSRDLTFSIITPSFNQARFIARTIESVRSQSHPAMEHLVFDGGSTDGTVDILRKCGDAITWESAPDRGQSHAVNKGFARAKGDVIGWINSDDIYCPGTFEAVVAYFACHEDADVVYGDSYYIDENDNVTGEFRAGEWDYERLKEANFIRQPALFIRRSVPERFGGLNEDLHYEMDYDYWLRIGRHLRFHHLPRFLVGMRYYDACKSRRNRPAVGRERLRVQQTNCGRVSEKSLKGACVAIADGLGLDRSDPEQELLFMSYLERRVHVERMRYNHRIDVRGLLADVGDAVKTCATVPYLYGKSRLAGLLRKRDDL